MYTTKCIRSLFVFTIIFISILCFSHNAFAYTTITDDISANTTWNLAGSPYVVSNFIFVDPGVTLTIQPGVIVKFDLYAMIDVLGTLTANGTSAQKIKFTSFFDDSVGGDTNGDGSATDPYPGVWNGISFDYAEGATFSYSEISFTYFGLSFSGSDGTLTNIKSRNNSHDLELWDGSDVSVSNADLLGSQYESIFVADSTLTADHIVLDQSQNYQGLDISHSDVTLNDSVIKNMHFSSEQAIAAEGPGTLSLNNTIVGNSWTGLVAYSGEIVNLTDSVLDGNGDTIQTWGESTFNINNSSLQNAVFAGIDDYGEGETYNINNSQIIGNDVGVYIWPWSMQSVFNISDSVIMNNASYGVWNNDTDYDVDFRNTWWGDTTGPMNSVSNPAGLGNQVSNNVLFDPWCTDSACTPVAPAHTPVLIVPGIAGTELFNGTDLIWADLTQMFWSIGDQFFSDNLILDSDGNSYGAVSIGNAIEKIPNIPVNFSIFSVNIFDGLKSALETNGYVLNQDLFYFPYDWRLNLGSTKDLLNQRIEEIKTETGSSKVDIIAHSMGGLLVKDYIQSHGGNSISKLIFIGIPHLGAPKAAKILLNGDNLSIPWLNQDRVKEVASNSPAVYELLPNPTYFSSFTGYLKNTAGNLLNYSDSESFLLGQDLNSTVMNIADYFFSENLEDINLSSIDTYNIAGCSSSTQAGYALKPNNSIGKISYVSGDGTVPFPSSDYLAIPANKKLYLKKASHAEMPSQADVRAVVLQILSDTPVTPTGNLKSNSSECDFHGKTLTWHSPVEVHIYDSQNRHTGPIENEGIERSIPGVDYEVLGHDKFVFLPTDGGENYHVVASGLEIGSFDLLISNNDNGTSGDTEVWNDVPITNTSAISFDISSASTPLNITVDSALIPASDTIPGNQSADLVPPVSLATATGTNGSNGWFTSNASITLSASDDNSGVLATKYSLDGGATFLTYSSPFVVSQEGISNIKYFSIDQAGNDEEQKTLQVKIDKNIPEINLTFDLGAENFVFSPSNPSTVTFSCGTTSCTALSQGGNQTMILFTKIVSGYNNTMQLNSISYNGVQTAFNQTTFKVRLFEKHDNLRDFDQTFTVQDLERLKINYFYHKDESKVTASLPGGGNSQQTFPGKKFLRLNTNQGQINNIIF